MSNFKEYGQYDATGLADLVRRKEVTPTELLDEAVARLDAVKPTLNAVTARWEDDARKEIAEGKVADGPLGGVPFLMKDLFQPIPGRPLTGSCAFLKDVVSNHAGNPPGSWEKRWGSHVTVASGTGQQIKPEGERSLTGGLICWPV